MCGGGWGGVLTVSIAVYTQGQVVVLDVVGLVPVKD